MPHGDISLGPGYYIIIGIYVLVAAGALAIIIDAMRPKRTDAIKALGRRREPVWLYQILSGVYLVVFALAQFSGMPHQFKAAAIFAIPVMVAVEIAYLLRVVFPKQPANKPAEQQAEQSAPTSIEEFSHDEHH